MPFLANARHENYAKHRAKGMPPKKAASAAGFAAGSSIYSELEADADVIQRVAELTEEFRHKREQQRAAAMEAAKMVGQVTGISKAWVLQRLAEVAVDAKVDARYGEAIEALKLIGDEFAMFKGGSAVNENQDASSQLVDLDSAEALLSATDEVVSLPDADNREAPIDMDAVARLIHGQRPREVVTAADRALSTGSETDVALMVDDDAG